MSRAGEDDRPSGDLLGAVRLVASDLDGTLLRSDGTISDRTVAALRAVVVAGIRVVFATGRPPRYVGGVLERTGIEGPVICGNGALVWDPLHSRPIAVHGFAPEVVREVIARLRAALPDAVFAVEQLAGLAYEPDYLPRLVVPGSRQVALHEVLDADIHGPVLKLLVRAGSGDLDALRVAVRDAVAGEAEVTFSSTYAEPLLELSAAGVTKATTLATYASSLGVGADQVLAFGDMPNDVAMLDWAGVGVAVAGGHPDALAAASFVTAGNDDDGVANVLEDLVRVLT